MTTAEGDEPRLLQLADELRILRTRLKHQLESRKVQASVPSHQRRQRRASLCTLDNPTASQGSREVTNE